MRKSEEYNINGVIYTARKIATECHCSVTTVYDFWSMSRGSDQDKFNALKQKMAAKVYKVGFTSLNSISQKTHYPKSLIYNFLRSKKGKTYYTEILKSDETSNPQVMIKSCDIADFIMDLQRYKKNADVWRKIRKENKEKRQKNRWPKKTIEQLKAEHPLVKDERFFELSFFPNIDSYTILTECNYRRPRDNK